MSTEAQTIRQRLMTPEDKELKISLKRFRSAVEEIKDPEGKRIIQLWYLLANRACEGLTRCNAKDFIVGDSRPYGQFLNVSIENFEVQPRDLPELQEVPVPLKGKLLLFTCQVAKRGKRLRKEKGEGSDWLKPTEERLRAAFTAYGMGSVIEQAKQKKVEIDPRLYAVLSRNPHWKEIALPLYPSHFEPWTAELLTWGAQRTTNDWREQHPQSIVNLQVDLTRRELYDVFRDNLNDILPPKDKIVFDGKTKSASHVQKNILRHFRLSHLKNYYFLTEGEITTYTGWSRLSNNSDQEQRWKAPQTLNTTCTDNTKFISPSSAVTSLPC